MALKRSRVIPLPSPFDFRAPEPVPGCDKCAALARDYRAANNPYNARYNPSAATDAAVLLRRHLKTHGEES
ncbi:hypothetical protein GCM10010389_49630 [Streptomyces echinoruber]|uniref:Uncharacterized protein n=1 Tax=Streptomyces echinoruber TaxID=68898 RepID=A0A918RPZ2_9ACTN|nr:hypothetical protein GCM10010389_49630 [Streptomyces echinoruber]